MEWYRRQDGEVVFGDDPRGRGCAVARLCHVDAVEQVEPDDDVAGRDEAVGDGGADPTARSGHHDDPFRHRFAPLDALSNMLLR